MRQDKQGSATTNKRYPNGVQCVPKFKKTAVTTRSEMAISMNLDESIGIVAMGNAPTALVQAIRSTAEMTGQRPLLVGVPVGFVNAAESKDLLIEQNDCYITSLGRKGGSPVAAAIINALIRLAAE